VRPFHLRIPLSALAPSHLSDLKEIILANRGSSKVLLHFMGGNNRETVVALSDQYMVDPSQHFKVRLQHLFKSSSVSFE
jgi:hypothetical protein